MNLEDITIIFSLLLLAVEWFFAFGFVIPGSTNSWEQIIEAAPPSAMLLAEELSGNVTIETSFLDNKLVLCKNLVRVFYV
jgi:retinal rod rhodopsin-sensitive cGMP 3',5'-cyclic phosphodiesterase subunit delta